jgi:hypothetical protein
MKSLLAFLFIVFSMAISANAPTLIDVVKFINHTGTELKRNKAAVVKIQETVSGQCFRDEFLKRPLIQANGKTNLDILTNLLSSKTTLSFEMYRSRFTSTVGYRMPSSTVVHMNRKFHDRMGPCDAGANISHEWTHVLGYEHDFKPSLSRPYSVPYSVGIIMEKCCHD